MASTNKSNRNGSPIAYQSVSIASGASLSGEIDTNGFVPVAVKMPATWSAANLTFQGCEVTAGTYCDVYDDAGTEYNVAASTSRWILLNPLAFASYQFLKIRSGTTGVPVIQAGARTLIVAMRKFHRQET